MSGIIKKAIVFTGIVFVLSLILPMNESNVANAAFNAPTCIAGDGCLPACSPPDLDCNPATCNIKGSGGFIPCGKNCNDPDTAWSEIAPCNFCSLFLMCQLIIEFMVKIAGFAALIAISIGGFMYVFAAGSQSSIEKAKSMIKYTLLGFIIIFIAWAVVDSILATAGYIDPIGGKWYSMNC